ncbi:Gfo/Idh/MocA family protein [Paenibacillus sp. CMAA1364]
MNQRMKIGIIGTDTSHSKAFTELLNDLEHPYHVEGGEVVIAYPGGSPDFELSISRVETFAKDMNYRFGVQMADTPEQVAEACDAILLLSGDGRVHLEQFEKIIPYGKPVFIDKPFANSSEEAKAIYKLAEQWSVPIMSSSALRYAEALTNQLDSNLDDSVVGLDCWGPMIIEPTQKGYFWYGIHLVEMLFTVLGTGCSSVQVSSLGDQDTITGTWHDGRIGTVHGSLSGTLPFIAVMQREKSSSFVDISSGVKPFYASLLEEIMMMFETRNSKIHMETTLEIIRFIEAANESRETGEIIYL